MMISLVSSELSAMIALSHQKPEYLHLVSFGLHTTPPPTPSACWVFYASLWPKTLCWLQKNNLSREDNDGEFQSQETEFQSQMTEVRALFNTSGCCRRRPRKTNQTTTPLPRTSPPANPHRIHLPHRKSSDPIDQIEVSMNEEKKSREAKDDLADALGGLFAAISSVVKSELQGTNNLLELLEKMNLKVADEYNGFGDVASGLRVFVEQLKCKSSGFDEYVKQIDSIEQQVTELEAVITVLDKYVSMLETKVNSAYHAMPS
ncbi:hypothetical protein Drorol1_Dr00016030 [Drosera rotundifolia]